MEVGAEAEDGGVVEPALAAPKNHHGSQVVWLRGNDGDREAGTPETMLPVSALPWRGSGNVVAAAGAALLDMVAKWVEDQDSNRVSHPY